MTTCLNNKFSVVQIMSKQDYPYFFENAMYEFV